MTSLYKEIFGVKIFIFFTFVFTYLGDSCNIILPLVNFYDF